jgi:PEP-CTERM motif
MPSGAPLLSLCASRAILTLFVTLILSSAAFSQTQIPCPVDAPDAGYPYPLNNGYNGVSGCEIEGPGGAAIETGPAFTSYTFSNYHAGELIIESGVPLTVSGTLDNEGTIINDGTIVQDGTGTIYNNGGTITNNSLIGIDAGSSSLNEGTINNFDRISIDGTLDNQWNLTNENGGTLQIDFGGTLTNADNLNNDLSGTILVFGTLNNSGGTFDNIGTVTSLGTINNSGPLTNFLGTINNDGTFTNSGWTLTNFGTITNYYGATFTNENAGSVINDITITNDGTFTNAASMTNNGTLTNNGIFNAGLDSSLTNNSGATILNGSGATLSVFIGAIINAGTINNYGTIVSTDGFLNIQTGGVLNNLAGSTYSQTSGYLIVDGTLNSAPTVQIQGGYLSGAGTINGNVNNIGGTVAPSPYLGTNLDATFLSAPGTLTINGNYTQGSAATLLIELGAAAGDFSVLDVSGLATLDGTLELASDGFTPEAGEDYDFTFLLFGSLSGDFASIDLSGWTCPVDDTCSEVIGANSLSFDVTANTSGGGSGGGTTAPEPSSLLMLAMGIVALGVCCRWKRATAIA